MKKLCFILSLSVLSAVLFFSCSNRISNGGLSVLFPSLEEIMARAPGDTSEAVTDNTADELPVDYYFEVTITNKATNYSQTKQSTDAENPEIIFSNVTMGNYKVDAAFYIFGVKYLSGSGECTVTPDVVTAVTIPLSQYVMVTVEFNELEDAIKNCSDYTEFKVVQEKDKSTVITAAIGNALKGTASTTSNSAKKNICLDFSACDKITEISANAFEGDGSLDLLVLPPKVSVIGDKAFYSMYGSVSGDFSNVESIGIGAFAGVKGLDDKIYLTSDKLTAVPETCFYGTNITSIVIGENVTELGDSAFAGCNKLMEVKLMSSSVVNLGNFVFLNVSENFKLYVKQDLKSVYEQMLQSSSNVTNVSLEEGTVEIIGF